MDDMDDVRLDGAIWGEVRLRFNDIIGGRGNTSNTTAEELVVLHIPLNLNHYRCKFLVSGIGNRSPPNVRKLRCKFLVSGIGNRSPPNVRKLSIDNAMPLEERVGGDAGAVQ
uniref:Uncharacterized protein n=1 Tax=Glossina austeni TaxID=7395 RepID=A0A1A9VDY8_GLOAU